VNTSICLQWVKIIWQQAPGHQTPNTEGLIIKSNVLHQYSPVIMTGSIYMLSTGDISRHRPGISVFHSTDTSAS